MHLRVEPVGFALVPYHLALAVIPAGAFLPTAPFGVDGSVPFRRTELHLFCFLLKPATVASYHPAAIWHRHFVLSFFLRVVWCLLLPRWLEGPCPSDLASDNDPREFEKYSIAFVPSSLIASIVMFLSPCLEFFVPLHGLRIAAYLLLHDASGNYGFLLGRRFDMRL